MPRTLPLKPRQIPDHTDCGQVGGCEPSDNRRDRSSGAVKNPDPLRLEQTPKLASRGDQLEGSRYGIARSIAEEDGHRQRTGVQDLLPTDPKRVRGGNCYMMTATRQPTCQVRYDPLNSAVVQELYKEQDSHITCLTSFRGRLGSAAGEVVNQRQVALQVGFDRPVPLVSLVATLPQLTSV